MEVKARVELDKIVAYPLGKTPEEIKQEYQLSRIRKMCDNENVYGYSDSIKNELGQSIPELSLYPDGTTQLLREQLAEHHQVPAPYFIISNGSEELLRLLTRAFVAKDDEVIIADVTFPRYIANVLIEGGRPILVPLVDGTHDLHTMYNSISEKTKMIFVCNPNNPTGTCLDPIELTQFIEKVPKNILVVLDEAYDEYMDDQKKIDSLRFIQEHSNLVVLRTFSKIYGLAALRVGYGVMNPRISEQLIKVKDVFNVNQVAQLAATIALRDQNFISDCAMKNKSEKIYLSEKLTQLGISFFESETNFLFLYGLGDVKSLNEELLRQVVIVRFFPFPQFNGCMRVTLGTREDNELFLGVLEKFYEKKAVLKSGN